MGVPEMVLLRIFVVLAAAAEFAYWIYSIPLQTIMPLSPILDSAWGLLRVGALVVFPACAAVGGALAIIGRRLGLAAALVAVEPLVVMALIAGLVLTGNFGPWITIGR